MTQRKVEVWDIVILVQQPEVFSSIFIDMQNFFDHKIVDKKMPDRLLYRKQLEHHYQYQKNTHYLFCFHPGCKYKGSAETIGVC